MVVGSKPIPVRESIETKLADLTAIVSDTAKAIGTTSTKIYSRGPSRALVSGVIYNNSLVDMTLTLLPIRGTERRITLLAGRKLKLKNMPLDAINGYAASAITVVVFLIAWEPIDPEAAMRTAELDFFTLDRDLLDLIRTELTFQHQADATLSQANPVQNTWYTVLDTTLNVRIIGIAVIVATTGETLQVRMIIDGLTLDSIALVCTADMYYFAYMVSMGVIDLDSVDYAMYRAFIIEGRSIKIQVRKTTANGTGTLTGRVIYAKR